MLKKTQNKYLILFFILVLLCVFLNCKNNISNNNNVEIIVDAIGREVKVPKTINHVICSGSGCLRLLTYLQAQDMIVAVDDAEVKIRMLDARPYALANPQFKKHPVFGEFRGHDNPEMILNLKTQPDVIFKIISGATDSHDELSKKVGIPVIGINYGNLGYQKSDYYQALRIMAKVLGKEKRAEDVINFFESHINELYKRTKKIPENMKKTCFIGGVAYRGPHGLQSTEPAYPPFKMVNANNSSYNPDKSPKELTHADIAKEKIIEWDPEIVFVDLSTLQTGAKSNALYELRNDPVYRELSAAKKGNVYGVLPYNWYTINYGSVISDAYYIGKILYPEKFKDINPSKKADEIYTFLVGKPVFKAMNKAFSNLVFTKLSVN